MNFLWTEFSGPQISDLGERRDRTNRNHQLVTVANNIQVIAVIPDIAAQGRRVYAKGPRRSGDGYQPVEKVARGRVSPHDET